MHMHFLQHHFFLLIVQEMTHSLSKNFCFPLGCIPPELASLVAFDRCSQFFISVDLLKNRSIGNDSKETSHRPKQYLRHIVYYNFLLIGMQTWLKVQDGIFYEIVPTFDFGYGFVTFFLLKHLRETPLELFLLLYSSL